MLKIWMFDKHCPSWRCHFRMKMDEKSSLLAHSEAMFFSQTVVEVSRCDWWYQETNVEPAKWQVESELLFLFASTCKDLILSSMHLYAIYWSNDNVTCSEGYVRFKNRIWSRRVAVARTGCPFGLRGNLGFEEKQWSTVNDGTSY